MRTAADFNLYYAAPDPWHISHARFRDKVLRRCLKPFIRGKSVLELGCGEGHLTQTIFSKARSVVGIDISDVAIARAKSLNLPNARFESADFLQASFEGYDVIAALECVYYLSFQEQGAFLEKVAKEHPGKILLLSGPIVDYRRHFSHKRLMHEFTTLGFTPLKFYNLSVYWHPPSSRIIANLIKLPLGYTLLDWIPESMIYQRLYALRAPKQRSFQASLPAILDSRNRKGILRQPLAIIGPRFKKRKPREPDLINEKTFGHFAILASDF